MTRLFITVVAVVIAFAFAAAGANSAPVSAAGVTQLCFAMDASGSMGSGNYNLEKTAIAGAIGNPAILPHDGSVEVTVVRFNLVSTLIVPPTVITAGNAAAVANAVQTSGYTGGGTAIHTAITLCSDQMVSSPEFGAAVKSVINVATDGISSGSLMLAARITAVGAGIDQVHFEAVGSGAASGIPNLMNTAWPQPAELLPPGSTPTDPDTIGFVMQIASFLDFESAIAAKVQAIVGETTVNLDVHPTSCPNPINPKSKGTVPVAILGTDVLDVADIDVSTLLLEGIAPVRSSIEDVATPWDGDPSDPISRNDCGTGEADGFADLTLKFKTQDLITALGGVSKGDVVEVTISGSTLGGEAFSGTDVIWIR
jgi:hypothetical protein